jgi:hypothetical protein
MFQVIPHQFKFILLHSNLNFVINAMLISGGMYLKRGNTVNLEIAYEI